MRSRHFKLKARVEDDPKLIYCPACRETHENWDLLERIEKPVLDSPFGPGVIREFFLYVLECGAVVATGRRKGDEEWQKKTRDGIAEKVKHGDG